MDYQTFLVKARKRRDAMLRMFNAGKTLQEIGDVHGVTRQRVQQVLRSYGVKGRRS